MRCGVFLIFKASFPQFEVDLMEWMDSKRSESSEEKEERDFMMIFFLYFVMECL